jgi:hypothetical protein
MGLLIHLRDMPGGIATGAYARRAAYPAFFPTATGVTAASGGATCYAPMDFFD